MTSEKITFYRPNEDKTELIEQLPKTVASQVYDTENEQFLHETLIELTDHSKNDTDKQHIEVVSSVPNDLTEMGILFKVDGTQSDIPSMITVDDLADSVSVSNTLANNADSKASSIITSTDRYVSVQCHLKFRAPNLSLVKEYGFNMVRDDLPWAYIETTKGTYDYSQYDAYINEMISLGIEPYMTLGFRNTPVYPENTTFETEEGYNAFKAYCLNSVNRYKDKVKYWEIWNEPDLENSVYATLPPATYARLLNDLCAQIKEINPNAVISIGALSGKHRYLESVISSLTTTTIAAIDQVSIHTYTSNYPEVQNSLYRRILGTIRANVNKPWKIVITEVGYSTTTNWNGSGNTAIASETTQGKYAPRTFLYNLTQNVHLVSYYCFEDRGVSTTNVEMNFGIVRYDRTAKPSGLAIKKMIQELDGFNYVERIRFEQERDYVLKFYNPTTKQVKYAMWTLQTTPKTISLNNRTYQIADEVRYFVVDEQLKSSNVIKREEFHNETQSIVTSIKNLLLTYGLPRNETTLDNIDLNDIRDNGFYRVTNTSLNHPRATGGDYWGGMLVFGRALNSEVIQLFINIPTESRTIRAYVRAYKAGTQEWTDWNEFITSNAYEVYKTPWVDISLLNGFEPYGTTIRPQYTRDSLGNLKIRGAVKGGSVGSVMFVLPSGYRPIDMHLRCTVPIDFTNAGLTVYGYGTVHIANGTGDVTLVAVSHPNDTIKEIYLSGIPLFKTY